MKIAVVTDVWFPHAHTAVALMAGLIESLQQLGHIVTVLHPGEFRHRPAPSGWGMDWALAPTKRMNERLGALEADILHIATEGPLGWAARQWAMQQKHAFTTSSWVDLPLWLGAMLGCPQRLGAAWQRWFHRPSSSVIVPCPLHARHLTQDYGVHRVQVWTPGVDIRQFVFVPDPVPNRWLGPLPRPVSLCVVHEGMTIDDLHAVLALDVPGSLVVCHGGQWRNRLERDCPDVHWLDDISEATMPEVYASADVLVQPAWGQAAQQVVLQAMACGTPVARRRHPADTGALADGHALGGAVAHDVREALARALTIPRHHARFRALPFNWPESAKAWLNFILPKQERQVQPKQASHRYFV